MKRKRSKARPELVYTIKELVETGGYCERSLRSFIKTGQLKASKPGRKLLIKAVDYDKFLNGRAI